MHSLIFAVALLVSIMLLFKGAGTIKDGADRSDAIWVFDLILVTVILWGVYHYMAH